MLSRLLRKTGPAISISMRWVMCLLTVLFRKNGGMLSSYRASPVKSVLIVPTMKFVYYGLYAKVCATKKSGSPARIAIVIRQKISLPILPLTAHIIIPCCRHPLMRQPLLIKSKTGCASGSVRWIMACRIIPDFASGNRGKIVST